jgi:hypothetical protein
MAHPKKPPSTEFLRVNQMIENQFGLTGPSFMWLQEWTWTKFGLRKTTAICALQKSAF